MAEEDGLCRLDYPQFFFIFHFPSIDIFRQVVNTGIATLTFEHFLSVRLEGDMASTSNRPWGLRDIPSQQGKIAVVTGATGGLGYETALGLALAGAEVVLAGRNDMKGADALTRLRTDAPRAVARFERVDLADLDSIHGFADRLLARGKPIQILVNNAAVMATPGRETTANGFELQLGTNYLSHFALTARLLPILRAQEHARVVNVSSGAHLYGKINFDDLQSERKYSAWGAYCQSKLAMLMFALELQRRSDANGWGLLSNAAHPGYARTDLIANGPGNNSTMGWMHKSIGKLMSHSAAAGALPILFAATAPEARPAGYYGPNGFMEAKGAVAPAGISKRAQDVEVAQRLWDVSGRLTGVAWSKVRSDERVKVAAR
jgi:NAD(P)-dependent dehydrogenase (short-subunit alcohol dehydrogenase family)